MVGAAFPRLSRGGSRLAPDIIARVTARAVFFDAGETLLSPYPSFADLFTEVVRVEGHSLEDARVREIVSASSGYFTELFRSDEGRLWSTSPERSRAMWDGVYRHFLAELEVPVEAHDGLIEALYRRFTRFDSYRLHPDALPTIERLRELGIFVGLISNFEGWLDGLLEHLGVRRLFDVVVISGIEGVEKPDPRIFEIALERSRMRADESVYVGDHPFFDIEAAEAAGMTAVLIDRRDRYPETQGLRLASLEQLPELLGLDAG